ncbi:MAG: hypothetical protein IJ946_03215 [Clostridia bacterium]|nr:hypothetical protein [Clostridia bacterium]
MKRIFDEHIIRKTTYLDGGWKFTVDSEKVGENKGFYNGLESYETIIVPSVWNNKLSLFNYQGVCWYQRDFFFEGTARLVFEGVMTECKVWLDGEYLGYHYGGFCQFEFIVPDLKAGLHKLVLRVDNSFDECSIPQKEVDWFRFGGITRSVSVERLQGVAVTYGKIDYFLNEDRTEADIIFTAELYGADSKKETTLSITLDGETVFSKKVALRKNSKETVVTDKITVKNVRLWDTSSPYLYTVVFSTDTDDLIDKVGMRTFEVKDCALWLNGKKLELRGVNRHEEIPSLGMSVPTVCMQNDLELIEDLGCNAIRGSHYPNSRIFLDMLDERGILFYSEIPIWGGGFNTEALSNKTVLERGLNMLKEMVKYYYNHPSIIFWGMHNEIITESEEARNMSALYYSFLKQNANNRLVTYATCRYNVDTCFEYCDVICINAYNGWYSNKIDDWYSFPDKFNSRRIELGFGDKPVIMSEFGGGAVYGNKTFKNVRWTEEYQANLIKTCLQIFHDCPYMAGSFIWQFANIRSDIHINRFRSFNNKGILSEYREPKEAYFTVKEKYHQFKNEENEE